MSLTAVIAPPPTPNGDLHLGHLAGPYLGADVYRRFRCLTNRPVLSAISIDTHQSYVVTAAERLGLAPTALTDRSHAEIKKTLLAASIEFDVVGRPDREYKIYIQQWFARMHDAGLFARSINRLPFDSKRQRFVFEAYARGRCPTCLAQTAGNICEDCGHPNDPAELLDLHATRKGSGPINEYREHTVFNFDIEQYREKVEAFFAGDIGRALRAPHRRLLDELLGMPLAPLPMTFPSSWGVPAPFPDAAGLVINPWAELMAGHHYWVEKAAQLRGDGASFSRPGEEPEYVQYLGFDNAYYYSIVHVALALAAREHGLPAMLPTILRTNEFYELGDAKFSTSNDAVILARDFLKDHDPDHLRFYLCCTNPEMQRSRFRPDEFERFATVHFAEPWQAVVECIRSFPEAAMQRHECPQAAALLRRFQLAYDSPDASLRLASETIRAAISATLAAAAAGRPFGSLARALAFGALPIVPGSARRLLDMLGEVGAPTWPDNADVQHACDVEFA